MRRKFHNARCWLDIKIHYLSLQEWAEGEHDRTTGGNRGPFPPSTICLSAREDGA